MFLYNFSCSGQICGVSDTTNSLQGIAIFNNSFFSLEASSCENVFMTTAFPPTSNLTELTTPNATTKIQVTLLK
jgi:hypothetical protein